MHYYMFNQWHILLLLIPMSYLVGLTIVKTVDQRMSDISINMPKIVLPTQHITVKTDHGSSGFSVAQNTYTHNSVKPLQSTNLTTFSEKQNPEKTILEKFEGNVDDDQSSEFPALGEGLARAITKSRGSHSKNVSPTRPDISRTIHCRNNSDCNVVNGEGMNKCVDSKCQCAVGSGHLCHEGNTYYKDPSQLTPRQLEKFKKHAKFSKMTSHDYRNWLETYKQDPQNLPDRHRLAFRKLLRGDSITVKDIPMDLKKRAKTGEEYYKHLTKANTQYMGDINLETGGWQQGYNADEYTEFVNPQDLKHMHIVPPPQRDEDDSSLRKIQPRISRKFHLHHKSAVPKN